MEIILLRHGKPKLELKGAVNAAEFKDLVAKYAQSGIQDLPSEQLKNNFNHHYVVCSNLSRSTESAEKLNLKKIHIADALFRETDIPHFNKSFFSLPLVVWLITLRIMWLFGFSKNGESFSQAKKRSKQAAEKLILLAQENEKIIVVGHGLINRLIGKQLEKESWQASQRKGKSYWEFRKYTINDFD